MINKLDINSKNSQIKEIYNNEGFEMLNYIEEGLKNTHDTEFDDAIKYIYELRNKYSK